MPTPIDYARVAILTLVPWYSFILLFETLTSEDNSNLGTCQDDNPCVFLRYFSSTSLPASKVQHLTNVSRDGHIYSDSTRQWDLLARFMYIRNGQAVETASLSHTFGFYKIPYVFTGLPSLGFVNIAGAISDWRKGPQGYSPPICTDFSIGTMGTYCSGMEMRNKIQNHLKFEESVSSYAYMVFITAWAALTIGHDWMLLQGFSEFATLAMTFAVLGCNVLACLSGVVWCLGALEVFVAMSDENDCACYYQMSELSVVLAMVTPLLLLFRVYSGLFMLFLSVQHGDFLLTTTYVVPYRYVASAIPSNPMKPSLHVETLQGGRWSPPASHGIAAPTAASDGWPHDGEEGAPAASVRASLSAVGVPKTDPLLKHQLSFHNLKNFVTALKYLVIFWHSLCATSIGTLVIGPLFVRIYLVVVFHNNYLRYIVVLVSGVVSCGIVFLNLKFRIPRLQAGIKALDGFTGQVWRRKAIQAGFEALKRVGDLITMFSPFVLLSCWPSDEFSADTSNGRKVEEMLPKIWAVNCAGIYLFFAAIGIFKETLLNEVQLAAQMRVLGVGHGVRPENWIALAEMLPDWGLDVQSKLATRFLELLTMEQLEEEAQVKRRFLAFLWPLHARLNESPADESHYDAVMRVAEEIEREEDEEERRQQHAASMAMMAECDDEDQSFAETGSKTRSSNVWDSKIHARLRVPSGEHMMDSFYV